MWVQAVTNIACRLRYPSRSIVLFASNFLIHGVTPFGTTERTARVSFSHQELVGGQASRLVINQRACRWYQCRASPRPTSLDRPGPILSPKFVPRDSFYRSNSIYKDRKHLDTRLAPAYSHSTLSSRRQYDLSASSSHAPHQRRRSRDSRSWRLAGDVVNDPVDTVDLVGDPG